MHFAVLRARLRTVGQHRLGGWARVLVTLAVMFFTAIAAADEREPATVGESERGMPGIVRVGVPVEAASPVVVGAGAGYGFMDETRAVPGGHRLRASLGAAYAPSPAVVLGLDVSGRMDTFSGDAGREVNLWGEPRLAARYSFRLSETLFLGAEANVRFIGGEAPSIRLSATTPSLLALFASRLAPETWLAANLGFELNRTADAIPDTSLISPADERTLGASSWNALPWGVGVRHRLDSAIELLGELSGELLVGGGAPSPSRSPYRVSVGARKKLSHSLSLMGAADVALSRRSLAGTDLLIIEPRVGAFAALSWSWDEPEPPPPAPPPPQAPPAPPPVVEQPSEPVPITSPVSGRVVDEGGRPLPDVEVTLTLAGEPPRSERTFADGAFRFEGVPEGPVQLRVDTAGYEAATIDIAEGEQRNSEVMLRPAVPAGQVRGRVLDLRGRPLAATISVSPGDNSVNASADGSFELELAPGSYVVEFRHEGHTTQKRKIVVANRGVVILNIALTQ